VGDGGGLSLAAETALAAALGTGVGVALEKMEQPASVTANAQMKTAGEWREMAWGVNILARSRSYLIPVEVTLRQPARWQASSYRARSPHPPGPQLLRHDLLIASMTP
jgi:hypothetical protein